MNQMSIGFVNNVVLKTLTKTLTFVDANTRVSTIALCKRCSGWFFYVLITYVMIEKDKHQE